MGITHRQSLTLSSFQEPLSFSPCFRCSLCSLSQRHTTTSTPNVPRPVIYLFLKKIRKLVDLIFFFSKLWILFLTPSSSSQKKKKKRMKESVVIFSSDVLLDVCSECNDECLSSLPRCERKTMLLLARRRLKYTGSSYFFRLILFFLLCLSLSLSPLLLVKQQTRDVLPLSRRFVYFEKEPRLSLDTDQRR